MALSTISGTTGITDATITSAKLADFAAAVDLNGVELILDADQDTSISADTDDRIDFKIANTDHISIGTSSGDTVIKTMTDAKDILFQQYDGRTILDINDGGYVGIANGATGPGQLRLYEDTDLGTNYTAFQVGTQSGDVTYTLPTADGSSGHALKTDGSGTLSWGTAGAISTYSNATNNRVITSVDSSSVNSEANLTFDGSTLAVTGAATISTTLGVTGVATFTAVPVFPNNTVETADIQDNAITLAKMAGGTDGNIISYDASGDPVAVATGSDGQVLTSSGAGAVCAFESLPASGKVLQVINAVDASETGTTSTSMVDTGLTATITPSATSSKVLVLVGMNFGMIGSTGGVGSQLVRGSTNIRSASEKSDGHGSGESSSHEAWIAFDYLDSPNTTSATTYKMQFKSNGQVVYTSIDNNVSTMTLMEIGA